MEGCAGSIVCVKVDDCIDKNRNLNIIPLSLLASSKVRHVLTDVRPRYAGIVGFEGHVMKPNEE